MNPALFDWTRMKNIQKIHRVLYAIGLGPLIGRIILLLTTTGRKSGLKRVTPLQFEKIGDDYYLGAARGLKADWVRNIQLNPQVDIRVGAKHFIGQAEVVTDPARFADFMEARLQRHPHMIGLIMEKAHGLPKRPSREQLEGLAKDEAVVIVRPALNVESSAFKTQIVSRRSIWLASLDLKRSKHGRRLDN
jgi:deazaflavin-dependent oxidoreductase (nitroreductase family)